MEAETRWAAIQAPSLYRIIMVSGIRKKNMKCPPVADRVVLITGCSSGIGEATARWLKNHDWHVIPSARKEADLESLREQGYEPVLLDLSSFESVERAAEEVLDRCDQRLGAIVNNAGFGQPGAIEDVSRATMRYQFEVNVFGMQQLTNRVIPIFRRQGSGRIVNISSVVGRLCLPFFGFYSASKFAMEAISDALRVELHGSGIGVCLIEPGPIDTAFGENAREQASRSLDLEVATYRRLYREQMAGRRREKPTDYFRLAPDAVSKKVLHALTSTHPRRRYGVTVPAYLVAFLRRFAPAGVIDRMLVSRIPK